MEVKIRYHGDYEKKLGIKEETIYMPYVRNTTLLYVMLELMKKYCNTLFGKTNISLTKDVNVKINGELVLNFSVAVKNGDIIDIMPVEMKQNEII